MSMFPILILILAYAIMIELGGGSVLSYHS